MLYDGTELKVSKRKGKVSDLEEKSSKEITTNGTIGMGHTLWATHGVPNDVNSHPHLSNSGNLAIIHNGIIGYKGHVQIKGLADHVIEISETSDALSPLLTTIPLQLLSYHIAVLRGCNVD
jgi:glucosamine 6-phosphate synthetase-like amidotransferase/phosphosugar isomerase protein